MGLLDATEFADATQRTPCMVLLDTSGSMAGQPIADLNEGLKALQAALCDDERAKIQVEVALVTFGETAQLIQDFVTVDQFTPPSLAATGGTPLGEAVLLGLRAIEERKRRYRENDIHYTRPWMFLMTDGRPTDDCSTATRELVAAQKGDHVEFFPVVVGNGGEDALAVLQAMSPMKTVLRMEPTRKAFREYFLWLGASAKNATRSRPGEKAQMASLAGWAEGGT